MWCGEGEVGSAAVKVESVTEDAETHCDAFDVPTGTPVAPRRSPHRLPRLCRLPQGEVERVFFVVVDVDAGAGALAEVVE